MEALTRWFEGLLTTPVTLLVAVAEPGGGRLMLLDEEEREDRAPSLDPPPPAPYTIASEHLQRPGHEHFVGDCFRTGNARGCRLLKDHLGVVCFMMSW